MQRNIDSDFILFGTVWIASHDIPRFSCNVEYKQFLNRDTDNNKNPA